MLFVSAKFPPPACSDGARIVRRASDRRRIGRAAFELLSIEHQLLVTALVSARGHDVTEAGPAGSAFERGENMAKFAQNAAVLRLVVVHEPQQFESDRW